MTTSQPPRNTNAHSPHSSLPPVIGAVLVHGLNGCQSDMTEIESMLQAHGIITRNMLLPGHGQHVRNLMVLGWPEWTEAVLAEVRDLKQQCDAVFLIGHSLGGALSLHAAVHEEVAGIVAMCAPLHMYPWLKPVLRVAKYVTPLLPTIREDVRDPVARRSLKREIYRWTPVGPVESLLEYLPKLRAELPRITAPALIMISVHDHVVPARDGREIYRLIGSREKHIIAFHRSYHIIMKDHDKEEVFSKIEAFVQRHAANVTRRKNVTNQLA